MGLPGEERHLHGSGRVHLLRSEPSDPVPLLLGPLVRDDSHPRSNLLHLSIIIQPGSMNSNTIISAACFVAFRFSDYKQTAVRDEDDDVAEERLRVYEGGSKTDILHIKDLSKVNVPNTSMSDSMTSYKLDSITIPYTGNRCKTRITVSIQPKCPIPGSVNLSKSMPNVIYSVLARPSSKFCGNLFSRFLHNPAVKETQKPNQWTGGNKLWFLLLVPSEIQFNFLLKF